jgi:hypothetical protein
MIRTVMEAAKGRPYWLLCQRLLSYYSFVLNHTASLKILYGERGQYSSVPMPSLGPGQLLSQQEGAYTVIHRCVKHDKSSEIPPTDR